jgi:hypothetical protein
MLGPFMYVFFILPVEVGYGIISCFSDERIRVGSAAEEEIIS